MVMQQVLVKDGGSFVPMRQPRRWEEVTESRHSEGKVCRKLRDRLNTGVSGKDDKDGLEVPRLPE